VALLAGGREIRLYVIRIGSALKVLQVAGRTIGGRAGEIPIRMTLAARHVDVRASEGELRELVMIERDTRPVDGRVADAAVLRESCLRVIRVLRVRKILQMTTDTACGSAFEIPVTVAGRAVERRVHPGQGVTREFGVIELGTEPMVKIVALLAIGWKLQGAMVGDGLRKILSVAGDARRRHMGELTDRSTLVAFVARHCRVRAR